MKLMVLSKINSFETDRNLLELLVRLNDIEYKPFPTVAMKECL